MRKKKRTGKKERRKRKTKHIAKQSLRNYGGKWPRDGKAGGEWGEEDFLLDHLINMRR